MPTRDKPERPLTLADLLLQSGKIPAERGGPFRNERMLLGEKANDPETLRTRRAVADELSRLAATAVTFKAGRVKGAVGDKTRQIRALVADHPGMTAKQLAALPEGQRIFAGMADRTRDNKVSSARTALRQPKKR